VLVLWVKRRPVLSDRAELAKSLAVYSAAACVGFIAFSPLLAQTPLRDPLGFLAIGPLLWAALRRGPRETATVALILSGFAVWGTLMQGGPFAKATLNQSFLVLLMFMISTAVPALALSADVAVRQLAEQSLRQKDARQQLLLNELNHRVKNTLATVQSLAGQTLKTASSPEDFRGAFEARLIALSAAHDLLTEDEWRGADLHDLLRTELLPYASRGDDGESFVLRGPRIHLSPRSAVTLAMTFHELATNAAKHGALKLPSGKVSIFWLADEEGAVPTLCLKWHETGGPPCSKPAKKGFGSLLIERGGASELGGEVETDFAPEGFRCILTLPLGKDVRMA
jgi:two-component sensor histidine kinase